MALPRSISTAGHLAPGPFALGAILVYLLGLASQTLLSPPMTAQAGLWPFLFSQIVLVWAWIVLHIRRLRDAGRPAGLALGIAAIYALEVVLVILIVSLLLTSGMDRPADGAEAPGLLQFFVVFYLIVMLAAGTGLDAFLFWITAFVILLLLPVLIGMIFSVWAATRRRVSSPTHPPEAPARAGAGR